MSHPLDLYPGATYKSLERNFDEGGEAPKIIVLHGTAGPGDPYNYWNRPSTPDKAASADLWFPKEGKPKQYVKLVSQTSWSNGPLIHPDLSVPFLAWLVEYKKKHPEYTGNTWTLSFEFEKSSQFNADILTPNQIAEGRAAIHWASENFAIPLDRIHILGHNQFDSVNRANCPNLRAIEWNTLLAGVPDYEHGAWQPINTGMQFLAALGGDDLVDAQDFDRILHRNKARHGGA